MDKPLETEMLQEDCHDMPRQSAELGAIQAVSLDAIVTAKLVCLSEEVRRSAGSGFFELQIVPRASKPPRRRS
jgi:hypothetical protein